MDRKKQHEKCICILKMIDKMQERIFDLDRTILANGKKNATESFLFISRNEMLAQIDFYKLILSRLFSYYSSNAIKILQ